MVSRFERFVTIAAIVLNSWAGLAYAAGEGQGLPPSPMHQPFANDCSVTVDLPAGTNFDDVHLMIDSPNAPIVFTIGHVTPFIANLKDPLREGSRVFVTAGPISADKRVEAARPAGAPPPGACVAAPAPDPFANDGRSTFEASGFVGRAFDNFAPSGTLGYLAPPQAQISSRWTAGVEAEYRLIGNQDSARQFWIATQTLHGVRTTDVNCATTPEVAVCNAKAPLETRFLAVLERASTLEAHVDARFEFLRLQATSDTPVQVYAVSRFGLIGVEGAPRVYNSDAYAAAGIIAPKGTFKGSFAQVGWGRSQQFQSDPGANRLKLYGTLVFDLTPSLIGRVQNVLLKRVTASRFFIAIVVDRNPRGAAPESVQTYLGLDFDLRRLVGVF